MLCGDLEKTEEYIEKIEKECEPEFTEMDYTYVECMKARYFHRAGKKELRDESISRIEKMIFLMICMRFVNLRSRSNGTMCYLISSTGLSRS